MRPLRVVHVVANRWWTGSAEPALDLAVALWQRGHHVRFGCIPGDVLEARVRASGLAPVEGVTFRRTARPWVLARDVLALRRLLVHEGIDVLHAHQTHDHWLGALARAGTGTRLVRTLHHRRALHGDPLGRQLLCRADAVLASSAAIAAGARAAGVASSRLAVVAGAVDPVRFSPAASGAALREALGLGDAPVVGCVARMVPGRGHEVLLRATALLRARFPALRLLLVGRGDWRPRLEALAETLGLGRAVVFAGYRGEDLPQALAAMDCVVLLAAGSEESCRAVLEAMAVGRPVVAARVGAVPETVLPGVTGWLVEAVPDAVAERLAAVLVDPEAARRMGAAGRRRVETSFLPQQRAERVEMLYRQVLELPVARAR
jgi:glycosyltransferase involved in cell wall biosynthesis